MRNRSAIWVFTILLTVACIYQLSFSWVTSGVEEKAESYAKFKTDSIVQLGVPQAILGSDTITIIGGNDVNATNKIKAFYEQEYLADHASDPVYPIFGISYQKCKDQALTLGLDLQGGMSVTLEVSIPELVKNLAGDSKKPSFTEPYNKAFKDYSEGKGDDFVQLFADAYKAQYQDKPMAYFNIANKEYFPLEMSNDDIIVKLKELSADAIDKTQNIIEARINKFGVSQPNIQKQPLSGRLHIELPGAKDKNRVRKLLQSTASLEFWDCYHGDSFYGQFITLNNQLENDANNEDAVTETETEIEAKVYDDVVINWTKLDSVALSLLDSNQLAEQDSLEVLHNEYLANQEEVAAAAAEEVAIDSSASKNNTGPFFSVFNWSQQGNSPRLGWAKASDTARVNKMLKHHTLTSSIPQRVTFMWTAKEEAQDADEKVFGFSLVAIEKTIDGVPKIGGEDISEAVQDYVPNSSEPAVNIQMKDQGANTWKNWTEMNVGKQIAIVLDNEVYSYPVINEAIPNGSTIVSGSFTIEEAQDLANILKAGSLPAPARIVDEAIIGPSLGQKNIEAGLMSFVIALILVLLYIMFYYNKAGIVAAIALVANIFFIFGTLASMGAALTLPGIAGLVLTIGMSVDANVLIFERIREELRAGKGIKLAIADGYKHAYSAIVDANITSLLTAIILAYFGSGAILGFATTLIVGVFTSLFSAIFVTRLIFSHMLDKKRSIKFANKATENLFVGSKVNFLAKRKIYYIVSGLIIVAGLGSLATNKLDGGVEFTGGRAYRVEFSADVDPVEMKEAIAAVCINDDGNPVSPEVKTVDGNRTLEITTKYMYTDKSQEATQKVDSLLAVAFNGQGFDKSEVQGAINEGTFYVGSQRSVDAQVSNEFIQRSVLAMIFSLIAIFLYIAFRFRRWQWGLGALVAMFHDVLVVLGLFSLLYKIMPFSMEIDQAFIAAILTVIGYSINDTVVVFDRIREYITDHKREDQVKVVNKALNSTLSRTLNTSLSTFLVLFIIFLFGGESIQGFSFALMVGVIVGTYSSICIATPSVIDLTKSIMPVKTDKK